MPFTPTSLAVLVCEKILTEIDGVLTAVRIVDVFSVLPEVKQVPVRVLIVLKAYPSNEVYRLALEHQPPHGPAVQIGTQEIHFQSHPAGPTIPTGLNIQIEIGVDAQVLGTHIIRAVVDGNEVATTQFTLLPKEA